MNQAARFNFGFASNMVLLMWCVCGGFLLHMLECNYLEMLVKPNFEKPVDTAQDVLDRGLTVVWPHGYEYEKEILIKQNNSEVLRNLGKAISIAKVRFFMLRSSQQVLAKASVQSRLFKTIRMWTKNKFGLRIHSKGVDTFPFPFSLPAFHSFKFF